MARKPNTRLDQLRAEVRAAHQSANRKIRRNEAKGIELEGSKYDPRRDFTKVKRYNTRQLASYLRDLNTFRSRRNQFVKGSQGVPLPAAEWRKYAKVQRQVNKAAAYVEESYADIFIDNSGMTVGQRMQALVPESATGRNPSVNSVFNRRLRRLPENVTSEKALRDLIKREQKKLSPGYIEDTVKRGRKTVKTFLMTAGRYDLMKQIDTLNTKQFHLLWQYTSLGDVSSLAYELAKARLMPNKDDRSNRWEAKVMDDSFEDVEKLVKWAGKVK